MIYLYILSFYNYYCHILIVILTIFKNLLAKCKIIEKVQVFFEAKTIKNDQKARF